MRKTIFLGLLLIFNVQLATSQSDSLKYGLKGKVIRALSNSPTSSSTFYAGLKGESLGSALIYVSEDSGNTWTPLNDGNPLSPYAADIQAIAVANDAANSMYAGTWKDGLFRSVDDGKTWKKIIQAPSSDIRSIKTGIQTPKLVYASTSSFGVIKSVDGGNTWKRNKPEIIDNTFKFAWSIEIDERNDSIVYAQTFNKGVWKSKDQGESWEQILNSNGRVSWDMKVAKKSNTIWVAASKSGDSISSIHRSSDGGQTWTEIDNVPQIGVSQINVVEQNKKEIVYVGSWNDGIYVLDDGNWKKNDKIDFNVISEILINGTKLLIGSWGNGVYQIKQ